MNRELKRHRRLVELLMTAKAITAKCHVLREAYLANPTTKNREAWDDEGERLRKTLGAAIGLAALCAEEMGETK
jgi:hypothetical protein